MRIASMLGVPLLVFAGAGCAGGASPPVRAPVGASDVASAPPEPCALKLDTGASRGGPASRLAPDLYGRALAPVVDALCACTGPEDQARIDTRIVPSNGEVRASAPDDGRIDACLSEHLRPGLFARFDAPPGVDGAVTAPARMAPSHPDPVQKFHAKQHPGSATPAAPPPPVVLVYSLMLDRPRNELRDASGPHVPAFEDR
jgi:hypothetical protein